MRKKIPILRVGHGLHGESPERLARLVHDFLGFR